MCRRLNYLQGATVWRRIAQGRNMREYRVSKHGIAASAERKARSPEASPVPIIALPISRMTARTSAKSGLMISDAGIEHLVGHREGVGSPLKKRNDLSPTGDEGSSGRVVE